MLYKNFCLQIKVPLPLQYNKSYILCIHDLGRQPKLAKKTLTYVWRRRPIIGALSVLCFARIL